MAAILMKEPADLSESGTTASSGLAAIVRHCLEKNVDQRFQSARDLVFNLQQLAGSEAALPPVSTGSPSVAVLPFANFSAEAENEFFADGVTEDVIANLSKVRSLKVISRTSVMAFKKREQSLREIGRALGAATILEGSIRRAGNRVRIVAQLIDAQTDEHLWAETFDRELTDIFQIQTEVALHIADALRAELSLDERSRIEKPPTQSARAYQLYLQARQSFYRSTEDGYRRALEYFDQAIAEDPDFALAHAGLAFLYSELAVGQGEGAVAPDIAFAKARAAVDKAVALDPDLAAARTVSASLKFMCDFDWKGAEREFELALKLAPGNADIYDRYSWMCSALGRSDDAIRLARRALELDPIAHRSDLAGELLRAGRYEETLEAARRVIEFEPTFWRGHALVGWTKILTGHMDEGISDLERAVGLSPGSTLLESQLGQAYAMAGRTEDARRILARLEAMAKERYVSPYHLAYVYTGLGEQEKAMDLLETAYRERAGAIYGIKGSYLFRSLHSNPRFQALLREMNLD
jgi:TolB-like protein/Tfp pilus assembly protein PilF